MTLIRLKNPRFPGIEAIEVEALADTGSVHLILPQAVATLLELEVVETRIATLANGTSARVPYVGPVEIHFKNRSAFTGALVMGDQVLLGAIPMEDMDLVLLPKSRQVDVNPEHPDYATART